MDADTRVPHCSNSRALCAIQCMAFLLIIGLIKIDAPPEKLAFKEMYGIGQASISSIFYLIITIPNL